MQTGQPNFKRRLAGAVSLLAGASTLCLIGWMGHVAQAQVGLSGVTIGVVDEDKLAEGFSKYKITVQKIDEEAQNLDEQLASREMLSEADGNRFDQLVQKGNRSDKENTELQNLVKKGADMRVELMGLIPRLSKSAADNNRIKELQTNAQNNVNALRKISDYLYSSIKTKQEKTDADFTGRANKVIEQVAGDKKLTLVVRKRAIVWNAPAIDITDDVLTRLNKS